MSAGAGQNSTAVSRDPDLLAPAFRRSVEASLADCRKAGLDAVLYEGFRSEELQAAYYARGRTVIPPAKPVTNAHSNLYSWHGYGLAVDVVHRTALWEPPEGLGWFRKVAAHFKANGCNWGGDWTSPDPPHMQWGKCRASPSDRARELITQGGLQAVWEAVGAATRIAAAPAPPVAGPGEGTVPAPATPAVTARTDGRLALSPAGAALIKAFEACMAADGDGRFKAYRCPADVLTIGWGHTNHTGRKFEAGAVWTQAECDEAFAQDMTAFEDIVHKLVKKPLSQHQFDALVAFAYNVGGGNLKSSTLLRKLNAGDYDGAALEFHRWNRSKGQVLRGLVRRRASEALMFQGIPDLNYDGVGDGPMAQGVHADAEDR